MMKILADLVVEHVFYFMIDNVLKNRILYRNWKHNYYVNQRGIQMRSIFKMLSWSIKRETQVIRIFVIICYNGKKRILLYFKLYSEHVTLFQLEETDWNVNSTVSIAGHWINVSNRKIALPFIKNIQIWFFIRLN